MADYKLYTQEADDFLDRFGKTLRQNAARRNSDVRLPPGKHCSDCCHVNRCVEVQHTTPTQISCRWAPCRFVSHTDERPRRGTCDHVHLEG